MQHPWLVGFDRGAAPAVVGLLGVTALTLAEHSLTPWGLPCGQKRARF